MDPAQVNMISDAKVSYLTADQQEGIQTTKDSDPVEPNPWPQESCAGRSTGVSPTFVSVMSLG